MSLPPPPAPPETSRRPATQSPAPRSVPRGVTSGSSRVLDDPSLGPSTRLSPGAPGERPALSLAATGSRPDRRTRRPTAPTAQPSPPPSRKRPSSIPAAVPSSRPSLQSLERMPPTGHSRRSPFLPRRKGPSLPMTTTLPGRLPHFLAWLSSLGLYLVAGRGSSGEPDRRLLLLHGLNALQQAMSSSMTRWSRKTSSPGPPRRTHLRRQARRQTLAETARHLAPPRRPRPTRASGSCVSRAATLRLRPGWRGSPDPRPARIPIRIIPGISAGNRRPRLRRHPRHPPRRQPVRDLRHRPRPDRPDAFHARLGRDLPRLRVVVIYLGHKHAPQIAAAMLAAGRPPV